MYIKLIQKQPVLYKILILYIKNLINKHKKNLITDLYTNNEILNYFITKTISTPLQSFSSTRQNPLL